MMRKKRSEGLLAVLEVKDLAKLRNIYGQKGPSIINDSILKVDTINKLYRSGVPLLKAVWSAGHRRLKPIVMTSLTTILAIAPFLVRGDMGSDLQYPLSLALISGMIAGTFVSVFFVPLAYYVIYKKSDR